VSVAASNVGFLWGRTLAVVNRFDSPPSYSSKAAFPFVPGVDGVGRSSDGRRVYFAFPRFPFGAMAELVPVRAELCVPVPDMVDDTTAAAVANPGLSSWAALTKRAQFVRGESVLINGATGVAGRLAIQIAKYLGAKTVIATGRNRDALALLPALGADVVIPLDGSEQNPIERFRREIRVHDVGVILDHFWGASAEQVFAAIAGDGSGG
jgi:NADPH:quinone reductase-like Zn-dependent oxidoreductase